MRRMIDDFINAGDSTSLSMVDDFSLIELIASKEENFIKELPKRIKENQSAVANVIENNLRKVIVEERPTNPKYFDRMSIILMILLKRKNSKALNMKNI